MHHSHRRIRRKHQCSRSFKVSVASFTSRSRFAHERPHRVDTSGIFTVASDCASGSSIPQLTPGTYNPASVINGPSCYITSISTAKLTDWIFSNATVPISGASNRGRWVE